MTKKSARLRAIAERLRSDSENERTIAVHKIERQAKEPLSLIIRLGVAGHSDRGIVRIIHMILSKQTANSNNNAVDRTIQDISAAISKSDLTWGDIVEKGIAAASEARVKEAPRTKPLETGKEDLLDEILPDHDIYKTEGFRRFTRMARDMKARARKAQPRRDAPQTESSEIIEGENFLRVTAEELPAIAIGIPYIAHYGEDESYGMYLKIRFHRLITQTGVKVAPMCDFIATGDEWIRKIRHAEVHRKPLVVMFGQNRKKDGLIPLLEGGPSRK